jgi:hypothetical protein
MKQLKIISPDKSRTFYSPIYPNLVRTGTIGDGSCFFHSVCYSLFSKYRKMNVMERRKYVNTLRKKITDDLTMEDWKNLGDGEIYRLQFISSFRELLSRAKLKHDFSYWDDKVLSELSNKWKSDINEGLNIIRPLIPNENIQSIGQLMKISEKQSFQKFKRHLSVNWADEFFMEIVSNYFKCNFHFINAGNRNLYKIFHNNVNYNKHVIICWINRSHYECIGELMSGNKVKRVFDSDDEIIHRIQSLR